MEIALLAALVLITLFGAWERRGLVKALKEQDDAYLAHIAQMESEHLSERRELATRIQRPEMVPVPAGRPRAREKPKDAAALQRVGTVMPPREEKSA